MSSVSSALAGRVPYQYSESVQLSSYLNIIFEFILLKVVTLFKYEEN